MTVRYTTQPVADAQHPGNEFVAIAGSYYDDELAVWCRMLTPGRNRDQRAVIIEPGQRQGKIVFITATAGQQLEPLVGQLILVDLEREKDRVCFGTLTKLALATIREGVPSSARRPDVRLCAFAVDSLHEAEQRLLAAMDQALADWLSPSLPEPEQRPPRRRSRRRRRAIAQQAAPA
jgi:hypothetical protein